MVLRIWGRRSAFNVQKALWMVGELDLPHTQIDAGGSFGGLDKPDFLAMNPNGRVPVVVDDGTTIWESHAILRYLAARHAPGTLWPTAPAARSHADRWMDWAQSALQPAFMELFWSFYRTPEPARNASKIEDAQERCARSFGLLDAHLARNEFLAGDDFTMGDIPAGTSLYRYFEMGLTVPELPNVRRWYAALCERAAYREHVMRPFSELRGRLEF